MSDFSLTEELLTSNDLVYRQATQAPFLKLAAQGCASKALLGKWLANDRLYIHSYIRGIGRLLSFLRYPESVSPNAGHERDDVHDPFTVRLLDWVVDALVNIRREERFFIATAAQYGIPVELKRNPDGTLVHCAKLEGLKRFEKLFDSLSPGGGSTTMASSASDAAAAATLATPSPPLSTASNEEPAHTAILPWLEAAVVFYGTEKCYLDAWTWAKRVQECQSRTASTEDVDMSNNNNNEDDNDDDDEGANQDDGAFKNEFIPNRTSDEFREFVDRLGLIIDEAVRKEIETHGESVKTELLTRALPKWNALLAAEEAFWPAVV